MLKVMEGNKIAVLVDYPKRVTIAKKSF
uniref:Uncharacterized protein n=1 Tax=Arundo donax TaxID=35708 RepID=A0A0A8XNT9_ARUDO